MGKLPNREIAVLDLVKIERYCLNPSHPRGRHKARVFREALGIGVRDAAWLRSVLLEGALNFDAVRLATDRFGSRWRIDVTVMRQGKTAVVRTVWIVLTDETSPRFVTCWIL
jgi:hypothetical protein